ncbi:MAG TPA: phospholipid carrier-dependent glycosyltransferase [Actinomycetota bacterium]|nr:phospholipid carrier-dependent glycosyltransferase [Actinomycetota bacterium]
MRSFLSSPRAPLWALVAVSALSLIARVAWISRPDHLLFDENYYVNAARRMLGIPIAADQIYAASPAGLDPNFAHPPLGKLLISLGIRSLGDNPLGWRFAAILFGSYAILALYWMARSAGFSSWVSAGAGALMAADTMFFVHGRIGTLEIFVLTFMLLGCAVYLGGRPALGGLILGVGACVKLVGFFPLLVLGLFELAKAVQAASGSSGKKPFGKRLISALLPNAKILVLTAGVAVASYLGVLYLLDVRFTNFTNPVQHTRAMLTSFQGSGLDNSITDIVVPRAMVVRDDRALDVEESGTAQPQPLIRREDQDLYLAPHSAPWEWLANRKAISYYRAPTNRGEVRSWSQFGMWTADSIHFKALVNPAIIFLAVPALGWTAYSAWRRRRSALLLPLAWFAGMWGMFVLIYNVRPQSAGHIYYMVAVMPAIYLAVAQLFSGSAPAQRLRPYYGALVVVAFFLYFPFKTWAGA